MVQFQSRLIWIMILSRDLLIKRFGSLFTFADWTLKITLTTLLVSSAQVTSCLGQTSSIWLSLPSRPLGLSRETETEMMKLDRYYNKAPNNYQLLYTEGGKISSIFSLISLSSLFNSKVSSKNPFTIDSHFKNDSSNRFVLFVVSRDW